MASLILAKKHMLGAIKVALELKDGLREFESQGMEVGSFNIVTAENEKVSNLFSLFIDSLQKPVTDDKNVQETKEKKHKLLESLLPVVHDIQDAIYKSQCILLKGCVAKMKSLESGQDLQEQENFKRASQHAAVFAEATALMKLGQTSSKTFRETMPSEMRQALNALYAHKRRAEGLSQLTDLMIESFSSMQACIVDPASFEKRRTLMANYDVFVHKRVSIAVEAAEQCAPFLVDFDQMCDISRVAKTSYAGQKDVMVQGLMQFVKASHRDSHKAAQKDDMGPIDLTADSQQWSSDRKEVLSQLHQSMQLAPHQENEKDELATLDVMEAVLHATLSPTQMRSFTEMTEKVNAQQDVAVQAPMSEGNKNICLSTAVVEPLAPTFKALVGYAGTTQQKASENLKSYQVEDACIDRLNTMHEQAMLIRSYVFTYLTAKWDGLSEDLAATMVSLTLEDKELLQEHDKSKSFATNKASKAFESALESDAALVKSYDIGAELADESKKNR